MLLAQNVDEETRRLLMEAAELREQCAALPDLEAQVDLLLASETFHSGQLKGELLALLRLVSEVQPQTLCEIGTARGGTLFLLALVAPPDARLLSIDVEHSPARQRAYESFARANQQITCLSADSSQPATLHQAQEWLGGAPLDFLFIDGDHSLAGVSADFELYAPLLRPGGIVALHDIIPDANTRFGLATGSYTGEVPRYWRRLKAGLSGVEISEFVDNKHQDGYGIGAIKLKDKLMPKLNKLELNTAVVRSPDSIFAESDGETVMLNLETSSYYGLDPIASRIWELLAEPITVGQICTQLQEEYEVEADVCRHDVIAALQELIEEQLARPVTG